MKVVISGYGNMGKVVEEFVEKRGHEVVAIVDPNKDVEHKSINKKSVAGADVVIDFSLPSSAIENIKSCVDCGINMVIATTGWMDEIEFVRKMVGNKIGFLYSSNFSVGVHLFSNLLAKSAKLFNSFEDYDAFAYEMHHKKKVDSPSGTALSLAEIFFDNFDRKNKLLTEKIDRRIKDDELHFVSIRGGSVPGTHSFVFDSDFDSIEIKHTARNRNGFALGSVISAEWLVNKKGIFRFEQCFEDLFSK